MKALTVNMSEIVIGRTGEVKIIDAKTGIQVMSNNVPYGSNLLVKNGQKIKKGDAICNWDPYNAVIISEFAGTIGFQDIIQGTTYSVEIDEQTGFQDKVISETRNKKLVPTIQILDKNGEEIRHYTLPVGAHIIVEEGEKLNLVNP